MPKIIENLRSDILEKSLEIIEKEGIEKLSVRKLSSELGIAPSTVYNYYDSKDQILGAIAMEKWKEALEYIDEMCESNLPEVEIVALISDRIRTFFRPLFLFHISSFSAGKERGETHPGHQLGYKKEISAQLGKRLESLLINRGHAEEDVADMAKALTGLIVLSIHSDDLDIRKLTVTINKLY